MDIDLEKITKIVADKSEITIEQARKAVFVLLEQFKEKMPEFETNLKKFIPDYEKQFEKVLKATPLAGLTR
ncbi:MAG TPA: hypothetical protein VI814_14085 [Candidatus Limnocylindria bacterium]